MKVKTRIRSAAESLFRKPRMGRRLAVMLASVVMMGVCVAVFDQLGFGTDPCSTLNLAVSRRIGLDFGTYQLLWNLALFAVVLLSGAWDRIGLGTVGNMVLVGYAADGAAWGINALHPLAAEALGVKIAVFIPTMLCFLLAAALYMAAGLGVAPYDAIPQIIAGRLKKAGFPAVRMGWDLAAALLGVALGGRAGPVTAAVVFFMGPLISAAARRLGPLLGQEAVR